LVVGCTGIVSGFAGAQVALTLDAQLAGVLFAGLLTLVAVRMGRDALQTPSPPVHRGTPPL